uniref:Uncharacterized protein n=1 Tax=Anolis carolinensis TaxID=28377 RepID=A0A803SWG6_ANOCA
MSYKDFQNELYAIGNKLWLKLQRLPKAEPVEIVCFSVIILFIGKYIFSICLQLTRLIRWDYFVLQSQ